MKKINILNLDIRLKEKKNINRCLKSCWLSYKGKYVKKILFILGYLANILDEEQDLISIYNYNLNL